MADTCLLLELASGAFICEASLSGTTPCDHGGSTPARVVPLKLRISPLSWKTMISSCLVCLPVEGGSSSFEGGGGAASRAAPVVPLGLVFLQKGH